jgi:predicted permease
LGASRWALARQSLIEGGLLAAAGAAAGLLIAWIATRGLEQSVRLELPPWMSFAIDPPVLLYLVAVTAAVGIFISLLPALRGSDADLGHVLRESGRGSAGSPRQERLRRSLVVAEVALAVALVATATFLVRSFQRLQDVNLGFHTADTLAFRVELGWRAYDSHDKAMQFSDRLLAGLGALPGVSAVASDSNLPLSGRPREPIELRLEGQAVSDRRNNPFVHLHVVSPAYFDTMGISIIRGRAFTAADRVDGEHVAVVGRRLADRLWPGRDPIGQRLMVGPEVPDGRWISVVGVAADIRHERVADSVLDVYRPYHQSWAGGSWFVLRTAGVEPASLARAATAIVGSIDPNQSFFDVRSMDDRRDAAVWQERLAGVLVALFGALAALLALVGLAGLVSFLVAQRRREIGVRLALGASPRGIVWAFVRGSGQLIGLGLLAGAGLAWLGSSLIRPLIFSPSGSDPIAFAVATLGLVAAAIAASWLTARRAALVDPVEVLRGE